VFKLKNTLLTKTKQRQITRAAYHGVHVLYSNC